MREMADGRVPIRCLMQIIKMGGRLGLETFDMVDESMMKMHSTCALSAAALTLCMHIR